MLKSHYGVSFGAQGNLKPVPDRIATMVKMGIGNMRLFCNWDAIELKDPDTGAIRFDFTILDGVIKLANQAGIAVTYVLDSAPEWHIDATLCQGKSFMKPDDAAVFLAMIAHRYTLGDPTNPGGLFIVGVEEANEGYSDGVGHCQIGPYAAKLSQAVYPAVKAVNPNLVVGSPAIIGLQLSYITDWWEAFYSNGGLSDYDGFHFYTQLMPNATPQPGMANFQMYYEAMAAVQAKYGHADKPIRCGEVGIAVPGKNNTTWQQQADFYLAALDIARKSGGKVEMVELFTIGAGGFSPVEGEGDKEIEHELVAAHASYVKQYPTWDTQGTGGGTVTLNSKGEVADFLDESQFIGGHSAYECVAYCASLCKFAGKPGTGPVGSVLASSNLAQYWYGREEGSNLASNTNGMSLPAEYDMLSGISLPYHPVPITGNNAHDISYVKAWLSYGFPVMICGHEDSFFDLDLGDKVPYSWTPTGNHCLVASGVASDGNLLVHDTASIAPGGVRPGPRRYDAAKMVLISGTAIAMSWLAPVASDFDPTKEETMTINLTTPGVSRFFEAVSGNSQQWRCMLTGKIIQYAILAAYQKYGNSDLCGLTYLGIPKSDEIPIQNINPIYQHLAGKGIVVQFYECGSLIYDPAHLVDSRPGLTASVYPAHIYDDNAPGLDPAINQLEAEITQLKASQGNPQVLADMQQLKPVAASFNAIVSKY